LSLLDTTLTASLGIDYPIIGGAMYPCSNPELVAAVSEAGGIGILQPLTLVHVHDLDFREGVRRIKSLTDNPIGMNVLTEKSAAKYLERMSTWLDIALEEGIRFFVSSLGNPRWIVDRVAAAGGLVYHDVTERKWAEKAAEAGVDGLIAVNAHAGGHTGSRSPEALLEEVAEFDLPVVCAGGVGDAGSFRRTLQLGYVGVQMGTRLIATEECMSPEEYKQAIVAADESDIVATTRTQQGPSPAGYWPTLAQNTGCGGSICSVSGAPSGTTCTTVCPTAITTWPGRASEVSRRSNRWRRSSRGSSPRRVKVLNRLSVLSFEF
jgi:nitronate monooxygenase